MTDPVDSALERLFDLSIDAMLIGGFDGYLRAANPAMVRMLGYTHEELLARPFMDNLHPDDVEAVNALLAQLAAGEEVLFFECRLIRADGAARWTEWSTRANPEEGVFYTIGRDITDRRATRAGLDALRRVATLIAEGPQPEHLFAVVAEEVARVVAVPAVSVLRYELDDTATERASFRADGPPFPVGRRWSLEGTNVLRLIKASSEAARIDDYSGLEGEIADSVRRSGLSSTVGTPIVVAGRLWGAMVASSAEQLPEGTERRLGQFTELLATAIDNAESRHALARLADEQAGLRRVATLVAQGAPPQDLFAAAVEEVGRLLPVGSAAMGRFEPDDMVTTIAAWSHAQPAFPAGTRWSTEGKNVTGIVYRTGRSARLDDFSAATGPIGINAREAGYRSVVGSPITVEGRLWGVMTAASTEEPLPPDTEARLASFTELLATAIANAESREALDRIVQEQAALRQVAVLVAQQSSPDEVLTAVTEAVGRLLGADLAAMHIYSGDGEATAIAGWSEEGRPMLPIGTRLPLDGDSAVARIFRSGEVARIDSYVEVEGETAEIARGLHLRSTVGAPIVVEGKLWGALVAATRDEEPLREDVGRRIAAFTELVATAISNAQAREALARLADEQAALRRVATLVAQGVQPNEIFSAVSAEVSRLFDASSAVGRYDDDGPVVEHMGVARFDVPVGTRWELQEGMASAEVYRTGRSARSDDIDWSSVTGEFGEIGRRLGFVSSVVCPIVVEGRLWGGILVITTDESLPPDTEDRLERFTELVAAAIANAESREALTASRVRIVAASDDTRRRIERDLHDGTQQRLVTLELALRAAEADVPTGSDELRDELSRIARELNEAVDDLRELTRGIHPAILSKGGLGPALRALARRSAIPVDLDAATDERLPEPIEVAAYFVASEALANATKHAQASRVEVSVARNVGNLMLSIRDDGVGGADVGGGSGLVGLQDRIEALGGTIDIKSPRGGGTSVVATLPLRVEPAGNPEESASGLGPV